MRGFGLLLITTVSWGLNWPVIKFLLGVLPPFSVRVLAAVLAVGVGFLVAALRHERLVPPRHQWARLVISALLNFSSFMISATVSMLWLRASEAVVIAYTLPIWAALLAWPVLGERPTLGRGAGMVLAFAGVALLVGADQTRAGLSDWPGIGSALLAAVLFALGTVIAK